MAHWMDDMYELCETVAREISEANDKIKSAGGKLSGADADFLDKLTHTMKSLKTTIAMEEASDDYSEEGGSYARGGNRGGGRSNRGGGSNARGRNARRDRMGRYSRDNYSREGYSREDAKEEMVSDLRELMQDAPDERTRQKFQRFISEIENA